MELRRRLWILAIVLLFPGCRSPKNTTVPDQLVGVWRTTSPKYADRFFEITKQTITFSTGGQHSDTRPISQIDAVPGNKAIMYTIIFTTQEGHEQRFSFYYEPFNEEVIRLKNKKHMTWTKERS